MGKNSIVITPDKHIYINPLPDKYDAMLDELHDVACSTHIQTWGSADLGKPYVIVCPALSEMQEGAFPYNPAATQLVFKDSGRRIFGSVSIIWIDDREGRYTYAGLTDEEAFHICADLNWTYLSLIWDDVGDCPADEDSSAESSSDYDDDDAYDKYAYEAFEEEEEDEDDDDGYGRAEDEMDEDDDIDDYEEIDDYDDICWMEDPYGSEDYC